MTQDFMKSVNEIYDWTFKLEEKLKSTQKDLDETHTSLDEEATLTEIQDELRKTILADIEKLLEEIKWIRTHILFLKSQETEE